MSKKVLLNIRYRDDYNGRPIAFKTEHGYVARTHPYYCFGSKYGRVYDFYMINPNGDNIIQKDFYIEVYDEIGYGLSGGWSDVNGKRIDEMMNNLMTKNDFTMDFEDCRHGIINANFKKCTNGRFNEVLNNMEDGLNEECIEGVVMYQDTCYEIIDPKKSNKKVVDESDEEDDSNDDFKINISKFIAGNGSVSKNYTDFKIEETGFIILKNTVTTDVIIDDYEYGRIRHIYHDDDIDIYI